MLGFSLPSMILMGGIMLASWLVSSRLKNKFEKYSKLQLQNGMSGIITIQLIKQLI